MNGVRATVILSSYASENRAYYYRYYRSGHFRWKSVPVRFLPSSHGPFSPYSQYSRCHRRSRPRRRCRRRQCFSHLFLLIRQNTTSYLWYLECLRVQMVYEKKEKQKTENKNLQIALHGHVFSPLVEPISASLAGVVFGYCCRVAMVVAVVLVV